MHDVTTALGLVQRLSDTKNIAIPYYIVMTKYYVRWDACTPLPWEKVSNTIRYRRGETVERSGDFQNTQF